MNKNEIVLSETGKEDRMTAKIFTEGRKDPSIVITREWKSPRGKWVKIPFKTIGLSDCVKIAQTWGKDSPENGGQNEE